MLAQPSRTWICLADGVYDPVSGELYRRENSCVRFEPVVAAVLDRLIAEPGRIVSRAVLLDSVWGDRVVVEESVTRCVSLIRTAFDDQRPHRVIETLPKRGYRFVAPVRRCTSDPAVPGIDLSSDCLFRIGPDDAST